MIFQLQVSSAELELRDYTDIKRHFNEKLCDKNRKPTGQASPAIEVGRAQAIYLRILQKESASNVGGLSSDEDTSDSEEDHRDIYRDGREEQMFYEVARIEDQIGISTETMSSIQSVPSIQSIPSMDTVPEDFSRYDCSPRASFDTSSVKRRKVDSKSKSAKHGYTNPRAGASSAINSLVDIAKANQVNNSNNQSMNTMMTMMLESQKVQQQQQQQHQIFAQAQAAAAAQAQAQAQQSMMMMMMSMFGQRIALLPTMPMEMPLPIILIPGDNSPTINDIGDVVNNDNEK
jgi:hypothetical protein